MTWRFIDFVKRVRLSNKTRLSVSSSLYARLSVCIYANPTRPSFLNFGILGFFKNLFIYSKFGYKRTFQEDFSFFRIFGSGVGKARQKCRERMTVLSWQCF